MEPKWEQWAARFDDLFFVVTCLDEEAGNPFRIFDRSTGKAVGGGFSTPWTWEPGLLDSLRPNAVP